MAWLALSAEVAAEFSEHAGDPSEQLELHAHHQRARERARAAERRLHDAERQRQHCRSSAARRRARKATRIEVRCCGGAQRHFDFWRPRARRETK